MPNQRDLRRKTFEMGTFLSEQQVSEFKDAFSICKKF